MNYFEHHIGDYDKNTSHLTACEDGIYHRMLRRYYDKERPLPVDVNEVKRIVRARAPAEKKAVDDVLAEFFHLEADGWHHAVCDAAIADYLAGEPEREMKKANESNRLKKHREERAELFKVITEAGEHAAWNTPMPELRALAKRITETPAATASDPSPETQPATAPETPATATHSPIPIPHTPKNKEEAELPLSFALPDWMPVEAWDGYVAMRKKQRKPMTDRARDLKIAELQRFRDAGHDIGAILDKSTANCWTDVYAPREGAAPRNGSGDWTQGAV